MKKILFAILPLILLSSCKGTHGEKTIKLENQTVYDAPYRYENSDDNKARIVYKNGVPVLIQSASLRTDLLKNADFLKAAEMEDYFAIAKETNMNTMEISLMWSEIEIDKDIYSFDELDTYLNFAKEYDLKLNIIWYGSFVDGETHTANIPKYISENPNEYPLIMDLFDFANYGHCEIIDWNNDKLLNREQIALYSALNHVYEWNHNNDNYDPIIMVQLGQGVDRLQRWRVNQYKIPGQDGEIMSFDEAWALSNKYIEAMGKAVKYSKYKALTRSEFCEQSAVVNYVRNIKNIEYVDIVCPTYLHEITTMKNGIKNFVDEYEDMPVINSENWANDINYKQIMVSTAMGGSGYVSYQLSAPRYFPESPKGTLYKRYNPDGTTLEEKFVEHFSRATDTKLVNGLLNKAFVPATNASRGNFASLGLDSSFNDKVGEERTQKIYLKSGILVDYTNPEDVIGYAIYDRNFIYCTSSKDAQLTVNNCTATVAQQGQFNEEGEWESAGNVTLENNKTLIMEAGIAYRIRLATINPLPDPATLISNQYRSTSDSIRS